MKDKKENSFLFRYFYLSVTVILFFLILVVFFLWFIGLIKTKRIIISMVVFVILLMYFKYGVLFTNKLSRIINLHFYEDIQFIGNCVLIKHKSKNMEASVLKLDYVLKYFVILYKMMNPFLYFLEIFVPFFYFSIRFLNLKFIDSNFVNIYINFVIYIIINPIIRVLILYYYVKKQLFEKHWLNLLFSRIQGLLIWFFFLSFWMTNLIEFLSFYYYIYLFISVYIFLVVFEYMPNFIIKKFKPLIEYRLDDFNIILNEEQRQQAKASDLYRMESYLLVPKLIDVFKNINIFRDRIHFTLLGSLLLNLFSIKSIIRNQITLIDKNDGSFDNIYFCLDDSKKLKKIVYGFIYELFNEQEIMKYEIKNKPSFVMYEYLLTITQNIGFSDLIMFFCINYAKIEHKFSVEELKDITEYVFLKIKLLKFCLFYIWYIEDSVAIQYEKNIYFSNIFNFDMLTNFYVKRKYFLKNINSSVLIDFEKFLDLREGIESYIYIKSRLDFLSIKLQKLVYIIEPDIVAYLLENAEKAKFLENEYINKVYNDIRKEYESNKNNGIVELINDSIINKK